MNLDSLTSGQRACVDTFDKPLVVAAGAGSGKTHTLTRRIARAFERGVISSIDEVLAITFTTKAAGELKSRVKSLLRSMGSEHPEMLQQALKVDDAWISTIHGMCARILRAYALEVSISPAFEVASEDEAAELLAQAVDDVLGRATEHEELAEGVQELFNAYRVRAAGPFTSGRSVEEMLIELVRKASSYPQGVAAFVRVPQGREEGLIVRDMITLIEEHLALAATQNQSNTMVAWREETERALEDTKTALLAQGNEPYDVVELLNRFPVLDGRLGKSEFKAESNELKAQEAALMCEATLIYSSKLLDVLLRLAEEVLAEYRALKHKAGLLDNNDLLALCSQLLQENSNVAAEFSNRFKLVMVDEFQDTDQVQLDMIRKLAGKEFERLCTVGDAQQSIYRFRGADVSVYERHLAAVQAADPSGVIRLPDNFRSHAEVLGFVDAVFEQPQAFGEKFMQLTASRDEKKVEPKHPKGVQRVQVQLATKQHQGKASLQQWEAQQIAQRFLELSGPDTEYSPGDMVVLLGKMTHSLEYAQALRDAGLPCVITGGSVFSDSPDVALVLALTRVLENYHETQHLYEVLKSDMFGLCAEDLLELSTAQNEAGDLIKIGLDEGLSQVASGKKQASAMVQHAATVLVHMANASPHMPASTRIAQALKTSGLLSRLQSQGPQGHARVGDLYKTLRLVEQIEANGELGPAQISSGLASVLDSLKTAPGALSTSGGGFVRIMTVHASKGLEFPVVAVASLRSGKDSSKYLRIEEVGGVPYVGLSMRITEDEHSGLLLKSKGCYGNEGVAAALCSDAEVEQGISKARLPLEFMAYITEYGHRAEQQEARRLAYVAFTRAEEMLIVSLEGTSKKDGSITSSGITADIRDALGGQAESAFPESDCQVALSSGMKVAFTRANLLDEEEDEPDGSGEEVLAPCLREEPAAEFFIPVQEPETGLPRRAFRPAREGVFSYSSISDAYHSVDAALAIFDEEDEDAAAWAAINANLGDADKATDLGTAFHRLAQYAVEHRGAGGALEMPPASRVEALAAGCAITGARQQRLDAALARWFSSRLCARVGAVADVRAEVPLFISLEGEGAPLYLEGEIDLLALEGERALIVDYKTGGRAEETSDELTHKHELQAMCYALAVMRQGVQQVEAQFVRVEQESATEPGQPQCVEFTFIQEDMPELERVISETYYKAQSQ